LGGIDLSQDLLEGVVEGPEGDAIFEIYEEIEEPVVGAAAVEGEIGDEEMYEAMAMEDGDEIE